MDDLKPIRLHHNTTYTFDRSVVLGPHDVRLHPSGYCRSPILDYTLRVQPADAAVHWYVDAPGNSVARFVFSQPVLELSFDVELTADLRPTNPFDFLLDLSAMQFPFRYPDEVAVELAPALGADPAVARLSEWVETLRRDCMGTASIDTVRLLIEVNRRIHGEIAYTVREEPGVHSPEQTLALAAGSCRDSSWLAVQVLRELGLAARFVSGYLIQPESDTSQQQSSVGQTQTAAPALRADLHAWVEVYLPGAGWIGLDPTSGLLAAEGHIALARARAPAAAAPVIGSASPSQARLTHRLEVESV